MDFMTQENMWGPYSTIFSTHMKMEMALVKRQPSWGNTINNILVKAHARTTQFISSWTILYMLHTPNMLQIHQNTCGLKASCMVFTYGTSGYPSKYSYINTHTHTHTHTVQIIEGTSITLLYTFVLKTSVYLVLAKSSFYKYLFVGNSRRNTSLSLP